jgi:dolichyl-diphosphooligosaccharide--protein glycosyltransferase
MGSIAGKFLSVLDPFLRSADPLVESVAEHRISAWGSLYYELGIAILFFAVGLYFVARNPTNKNLFLLIFGLTSLYFSSSMVRLLVIFAPAFGLLAAVGIVGMLKPFVTLLKEPPRLTVKKKFGFEHVGKEFSGTAVFLIFLVLMTNFAISPQSGGMPKVYKQSYAPVTITAGSLPIAPNVPVNEWFDALQYLSNLHDSTTVVCSWWDYGYWLAILGNVTSLADNATINGTSIENVGFTFMANETCSLKMLESYHAKYILVFETLYLYQESSETTPIGIWRGYGDEGKWMWMARISGKAKQRFIDEGFLDAPSSWDNETSFGNYTNNQWVWSDTPQNGTDSTVTGKNSTIYKLMSWGKYRWCSANGVTPDEAGIQPTYFKEAYFAGLNLSPNDAYTKYGNIIPLICIYEIDYTTYHNALSG